jgi:hypothetical protein
MMKIEILIPLLQCKMSIGICHCDRPQGGHGYQSSRTIETRKIVSNSWIFDFFMVPGHQTPQININETSMWTRKKLPRVLSIHDRPPQFRSGWSGHMLVLKICFPWFCTPPEHFSLINYRPICDGSEATRANTLFEQYVWPLSPSGER